MEQTIINNLILLGIAGFTAFGAWQANKTANLARATYTMAKLTELNTNSMKDALVAATKLSSHAEGLEQGRVEGKTLAAEVALDRMPNRVTVK